ncbi:glucan ABC transporter ATP-binding protein/ permease [Methylocystis sp.]|uniref:glucan ABC transporter ATP-binding protein/ permease n=1 Tax=Methylocystis sp. TaxID=1911079 RepID=UPI0011D880A6|nr:glucan ABC transporter ATP-binding protein/ permease [Methylocystis sp.]KAF0134216.1 MAG: glucan exporter ATP-binding protein [Methylocystaceae bacterium]KAF0211374.1 MAG: glucan exporter ATP-binding [Methylocystaceae bacterium]MDP3552447.1 glucan ABC transporter ATP-binding protein/ permease [Methylocystis sp.]TXT43080.1 MAG: glucan exporter ATP-binding protein [Methylocystaceae bacterium]
MSVFKVYVRVLGLLRPQARLALILVAANLALAISAFAEPMLFGRIIDRMTRAQAPGATLTWSDLLPLVSAWAGFGLFSIGGAILVGLNADRLAHRRRLAIMSDYFDHVLSLPLSFHTNVHSGRLLKIMLDGANAMSGLWLSFFRENCASFVALFVLLPATLFVNWRLGSLLMALVVIFYFVTSFVLRRTEDLQGQVERYNSTLAEHASDALGNIPVVQSFTRIESESHALNRIIDDVIAAQMPVLSWWAFVAVASRASATLTILAIFLLGIWLHLRGLATIGEIVAFMSFATMLIARLEQAVGFVNVLFQQSAKIAEFFGVLDTPASVADRPHSRDAERLVGAVEFDNVTFAYDGRRPAVRGVSFTAKPGETIALVGSTGSGKSTTLGLLHRAFDPDSGSVKIDGVDIREFTLSSLRRNIGVVFQEPMLFARSIEENLRIGNPDATDEEIAHALELAQATEFVAHQSDGRATRVGERGRSLSGGERQRLSIARALLKNPPIMVFDEATSALDATTERLIQKALEAAMKGRTTFVIAHRLATVRNADRILVFDQGEIVESGGFDELVAKGGRFAMLAAAQFMTEPTVSTTPLDGVYEAGAQTGAG